MKKKIRIATLL